VKSRTIIAYIFGIALILSSLLYIGYAVRQADALIPRDTVIITPVRNDALFLFETDSVAHWASSYNGSIVAESVTVQAITNRAVSGYAQLSVFSGDYFDVVELPFIYGNPAAADDGRVVVLCRNMADALFGAADVVGLTVQVMGTELLVAGVVEALAQSLDVTEGFVWTPYFELELSSVLYISPEQYNPLSARLDAESLLMHLNKQADTFTVTDTNAYQQGFILRGQILLLLCVTVFLVITILWLIRLFKSAQKKIAYAVAAFLTALTAIVAVYFALSISTIDLWLPAYVGEGLSGYRQLIFNEGLLAPGVYLPMHLSALTELNIKVNVALCTGLFGLLLIGIIKFLTVNTSK